MGSGDGGEAGWCQPGADERQGQEMPAEHSGAGNKRIALAAMVVFLDLKRWELTCTQAEETAMILRAAAGELGERSLERLGRAQRKKEGVTSAEATAGTQSRLPARYQALTIIAAA